jgi:hypothetical protein
MSVRAKRIPPALKHGGYSATRLLPGEDPVAFTELHNALIDELSPAGALEVDIVASIARLVWRKRHLTTFRVAGSVLDEKMTNRVDDIDPDKARKEYEAFQKGMRRETLSSEEKEDMSNYYKRLREAQKEYDAIINRDDRTSQEQSFLMNALAVEERLDTMIDRCLKRLLFLRGLKSLTPAKSASPPTEQKRVRKV